MTTAANRPPTSMTPSTIPVVAAGDGPVPEDKLVPGAWVGQAVGTGDSPIEDKLVPGTCVGKGVVAVPESDLAMVVVATRNVVDGNATVIGTCMA